ncbi:hypothetical protein JRI60_27385 [Archangium violaceum]|uniref:hypothetical protein n=1 Tax=Archangium violaceum TaxID=83451 RepID=UPI00194EC359|nr:hypothetical protein [Archangium violaceum]QRO03069.1 hypothetical protein JRI60_27385 [Archangium violaceum]
MRLRSALVRLLGLVLVAFSLQACPSPDETPPPTSSCASTCEGCCRVDGRCMPGTALTVCGKSGNACQSCAGRACVDGACAAVADAGSTPPDAGTTPDAGNVPDAGNAPDAGQGSGDGGVDAGQPPDSGVDAGVVATGNGCADPIPIKVIDGGAQVVGDTSGHEDRGAGPCGGFGGRDVTYLLQGPSSGQLVVTVAPLTSGGLKPVVYMSELCDTPKYCVAAGTAGGTATLVIPAASSGKYYLWVDGAPGTAGSYSLTVNASAAVGESCGAPIPLPFGEGEANVSVADTRWSNETRGSCETWTSSGDHVYRLTVDRVQNLEVNVSAEVFLGDTYLRSVCGGGELACSSSAGNSSVIRQQELAPGTYYLWRDTPGDEYELYAHLSDPIPGDTCASARPLVFSKGEEGGTATVTTSLQGTFDNNTPGCGSSAQPDLVYTFTTSKPFDFRASASGQRLSLRSATCTGQELGCGANGLALGQLPPGTYYLWIDNDSSGARTPFTLSASLSPPSLGDSCLDPEPLVFSGGSLGGDARAQGDLSTRFGNSRASCGGGGGDHVYTFTTSTTLNLRASTSQGHTLYLRSGACPSDVEVACSRSYEGVEAVELNAGTYQLWVDSDSGGGAYSLWASLTRPACQDPLPLVFSGGDTGGPATATASGSTFTAFSTTQGSCGGTGGKDVAYVFELTEPRRLDATVTSTSPYLRPVLYLRASCGADEQACVAAPAADSPATLSTGVLPPGRYYLWVDGFTGSAGPYSLSATLR